MPIFSWSAFVFGSTPRDHRLREYHAFENDRLPIAQCVAGGGVFNAHRCGDFARMDFLDFFALVCVHLQNTADAFPLVLVGLYTVSPD